MSALRLRDFCQPVFFFVSLDIFPRGLDFVMRADAKTVVIVEGFFRRVRPAFMDDQVPIGIRMFQRRLSWLALDDFHGQEIGEDR